MIVLFDPRSYDVTLVLIDSAGTEHRYSWDAGRTLARDVLGYLRDKLAEHGSEVSSISAIGVAQGPGSFTGLRIGLTVMNTLAHELRIPIVGATGDEWEAIVRQRLSAGENDTIVMPEYGGDAHITAPKK